jgi:EAL domain-containing protein (putative c-di-GMP-specific phosphodiesterase class I)
MRTDLIKLDIALVHNIDKDKVRQAIIKGTLQVCKELSILTIAEGVSTQEELTCLQSLGIELFQGFYFAKPSFKSLATISWEQET